MKVGALTTGVFFFVGFLACCARSGDEQRATARHRSPVQMRRCVPGIAWEDCVGISVMVGVSSGPPASEVVQFEPFQPCFARSCGLFDAERKIVTFLRGWVAVKSLSADTTRKGRALPPGMNRKGGEGEEVKRGLVASAPCSPTRHVSTTINSICRCGLPRCCRRIRPRPCHPRAVHQR